MWSWIKRAAIVAKPYVWAWLRKKIEDRIEKAEAGLPEPPKTP